MALILGREIQLKYDRNTRRGGQIREILKRNTIEI